MLKRKSDSPCVYSQIDKYRIEFQTPQMKNMNSGLNVHNDYLKESSLFSHISRRIKPAKMQDAVNDGRLTVQDVSRCAE